jgi:hypothetical protein
VRIVDGSDGKTYIIEESLYGDAVSVMRGTMDYQEEYIPDSDPRYAGVMALFDWTEERAAGWAGKDSLGCYTNDPEAVVTEAALKASCEAQLYGGGPRADMICKCGSVLSAVTFECVRGEHCPASAK